MPIAVTKDGEETAMDPWTLTGYKTVARLQSTSDEIIIEGQGKHQRLLKGKNSCTQTQTNDKTDRTFSSPNKGRVGLCYDDETSSAVSITALLGLPLSRTISQMWKDNCKIYNDCTHQI